MPTAKTGLIAAYGEWWDPHEVAWGQRGRGRGGTLLGTVARKSVSIDVWDQRGIYVLFQDWQVVYVGKTGRQALGKRLRDHLADDIAGRWDRFSWYGVRRINLSGTLGAEEAPQRQLHGNEVISALEALLIRVTVPTLSRRREELKGADLVIQETLTARRSTRGYLVDIEQRLDDLIDGVKGLTS
jgi:hypothetical protein